MIFMLVFLIFFIVAVKLVIASLSSSNVLSVLTGNDITGRRAGINMDAID